MGDFSFNISKGRIVEFYNRVDSNDPANSALIVAVINTAATDATLKDLDTLAAIEADSNTAEVTNSGYARKVLTDADIVAFTPDDTNDRIDLDIPDQTWSGIGAGDTWTDIVICYDGDTTGGTDADIVPMTQHDFAISPDGSDITASIAAAGFYRIASVEPLTYTDGYGGDVNTAIDVNLHETAHTYNGGQHSAIQFGDYNYGLMKFNISAIPAGSTVISATLHLGLYEGGGNANIYAVLSANDGWIEGTGDFDLALEDEPCWDAKQADGAAGVKTAWAGGSNGCGVVGTDISASTIGALTGTGVGVFEVDLDTDTVQGWIGETNTNYGILIIPTTTSSNHIALSEYGTAEYRPKLVVEYTA